MTERLYYRDSFLYEFDGKVLEIVGPSEKEPRTGVILDRTAFYPSSGGQVHDRGVIDASRRRDHMQQHSGQHILSAAFVRLFGIPTVFHMGEETCSIDVQRPSVRSKSLLPNDWRTM
jgi:alanyl-tRNA synthetase